MSGHSFSVGINGDVEGYCRDRAIVREVTQVDATDERRAVCAVETPTVKNWFLLGLMVGITALSRGNVLLLLVTLPILLWKPLVSFNKRKTVGALLLGGVLSATLVPLFSTFLEEDDDESTNVVITVAAMLMAGLDGIQNKIHPGDAADKDLYDLPPEEGKAIPTVAATFDQALAALDADREFLTAGGVFSDDMIDAYIELKEDEIERLNMTTHPVEFDMYYSV